MFGSSDSIDLWLDSVCRVAVSVIDPDSVPWEPSVGPVRLSRRNFGEFEVFDATVVLEDEPSSSSWTDYVSDTSVRETRVPERSLAMLWAQVKLLEDSCHTDNDELDAFQCETPQVASPMVPAVVLDSPVRDAPRSTCSLCGQFLIQSLMSPPGYCEYSGRLICGSCFDPIERIVPHRLLSGCMTVRGNVSRQSAKEILDLYYVCNIRFSEIVHLCSESVCALIAIVDQLRGRFRVCLPVLASCPEACTPSQLPAHFLSPDSFEYSLGDLVDILAPRKRSLIVSGLERIVSALESHSCVRCESLFSTQCSLCESKMRKTSLEWICCQNCKKDFHSKCWKWLNYECPYGHT